MKSFLGTIKNGKIEWNNEYGFGLLLQDFPGREVRLELLEKTRTMSQNNYYWLYLGMIENETGNLADDLHEWCKRKFLPAKFIKINGEDFKVPSSTTDLKKQEFGDYLDKICAWSGVELPNPEDYGYLRKW